MKILNVAVPVPLYKTFDYQLPNTLTDYTPSPGQRVLVPFGTKQRIGVIVGISNKSDISVDTLKPIDAFIDDSPIFDQTLMRFITWAATYYLCPLGEALDTALPSALRENKTISDYLPLAYSICTDIDRHAGYLHNKKAQREAYNQIEAQQPIERQRLLDLGVSHSIIKKLLEAELIYSKPITPSRFVNTDTCLAETPQTLTESQAHCVAIFNQRTNQFSPQLLDGVTGSGKTEVYLHMLESVLSKGKQALVLVPEIGLTPQTVARFKARFSHPVSVWHSGMNKTERFHTWNHARLGSTSIVIGTRSSIFIPFNDLGLIIIDEEHDTSFKQQDGFKYNARDLAVYRAKQHDIPIILGTATPSFETLRNAQLKRYQHTQLSTRISGYQLKHHCVDLKKDIVESGLSTSLKHAISTHLQHQHQVMLFINRRGYSPALICHECGWLTQCHRCSATTTYHKQAHRLICHHCGTNEPVPTQCHHCGSSQIYPVGQGTEQLEETLTQLFPDTDIIRIDRDTTARKHAFDEALEKIHQNHKCIIIGTQMLAKGHHFPNVSLVGILDVDSALYSSDFRAAERLAQLVTQVSGRAGRGRVKGESYLQTYHPEHPLLQDLLHNGYQHFSAQAIAEREAAELPPFSSLVLIKAESTYANLPSHFLNDVKMLLMAKNHELNQNITFLGPIPSPMERRAGKFRFQLLLQHSTRGLIQQVLTHALPAIQKLKLAPKVRWTLDVDPQDMS